MSRTPDWRDHTIVARGREVMHAPWGAYADRPGGQGGRELAMGA
jgi:hypothetical protein